MNECIVCGELFDPDELRTCPECGDPDVCDDCMNTHLTMEHGIEY